MGAGGIATNQEQTEGMMMETKYTPGPWIAREIPDGPDGKYSHWIDGGPHSSPLADVREYHNGVSEANAARIVECVNAHDAMLADNARLREALEKSAKWMDFVAEKLGNPEELDCNILKYGARKWVKQFGQGAKYRSEEARAALEGKVKP